MSCLKGEFTSLKFVFGLMVIALVFQARQAPAQDEIRIPGELTLAAAKDLLVRHSPQLKAERLNIDVERGDVIGAEKLPNPDIEFRSEGLGASAPARHLLDKQQVSLVATQEILTAGKRQKRTRLEEVDVEIAEMEFQNVARLVSFELKQAYYAVVLAQEDLKLAREILEQFRNTVALNRAQFEKGEISGGELRRVEAAQFRFYDDVITSEVLLQNAQDGLLAVLGSSQFGQNFQAIDGFHSQVSLPRLPELRDTALRERTDLAADRARMVRADRDIALQQALAAPNVTAFAGYRRDFGADGAIAGIQVPLFVFNKNQGPLARSQALRLKQQQRLRIVEINVLKEVQLALNELMGNGRRIESLQGEYLEKARQSRTIAQSAYRLGAASLIEFLEAERTYRETSRLYNRALYDYQISRARLEMAVGKDF